MRLVGNIIWFVFAGFWLFLGYSLAALLCFIFIVTIPFGVAALRIAFFAVWPFGRTVVPQAGKGVGSTIGNIIWFVLGGWYLALLHIITGIALCLTIIGIPLGLANFKLITVSLRPFGREIVSVDEARRRGARATSDVLSGSLLPRLVFGEQQLAHTSLFGRWPHNNAAIWPLTKSVRRSSTWTSSASGSLATTTRSLAFAGSR